MSVTIKFKGYNDSNIVKWSKLSLFAIGALIALPMMIICVVLFIAEYFCHNFIAWLKNITDTDVNFN